MKYEIKGGNFPVVICTCDAGEKLLCEAGAMSWMRRSWKGFWKNVFWRVYVYE